MPNAVSLDAAASLLEEHGFVIPKRALLREVRDERDDLLNRLARIGVLIPGVEKAELSRLRDLVQWQEERALQRVHQQIWEPDPTPRMTRREKLTALREYWHRKVIPQRESRRYLYQGSGTQALSVSGETA